MQAVATHFGIRICKTKKEQQMDKKKYQFKILEIKNMVIVMFLNINSRLDIIKKEIKESEANTEEFTQK